MTPDQIRSAILIAEAFRPGEAFLDAGAVMRLVSRGALPYGTEGPLTPAEALTIAELPPDALLRVAHRLKLPYEAASLLYGYISALCAHSLAMSASRRVLPVRQAFNAADLAIVTGRAKRLDDCIARIEAERDTSQLAVMMALAKLQQAYPWVTDDIAKSLAINKLQHSYIPSAERDLVSATEESIRQVHERKLLSMQLTLSSLTDS